MERRARRSIPRDWHRATLPVPYAYSFVSFVERLSQHLTANWPGGKWVWAPGRTGSAEIVLATDEIGALPVLLAHVLVLTYPDSQPHRREQSAATMREILRQPYGWAAGVSQSIFLLDRLDAPPQEPAVRRPGINGHANGHKPGVVEDPATEKKKD